VPRRTFGTRRDEVTGRWKVLHKEALRDFYSSASKIKNNQVKEDEMGRKCSMNGEKSNACMLLVGNLERKRPF
jgi:hypothetical protein